MPVSRSFRAWLGVIWLLALAVRLALAWHLRDYTVQGDALTFHLDAGHLADGHGFQRAFEAVPTAEHPPAQIVFLGGLDLLGFTGLHAQKLFQAGLGSITVVLIALVGREWAGARAGLLAGAVAAIYPNLFAADASLMSETLYGVFIVAALLAALAFERRPTPDRAALLGGAIGLAALTRGEAIGLLVLMAAPLAWRGGGRWRGRVGLFALMCCAFALVLAPWTIRNLQTFKDPVLISTNSEGVWIGANCHDTFYVFVGAWRYQCYGRRAAGDESQYSADYRRRGMRYIGQHVGRLPVVVLARIGRLLDVYEPEQDVFFDSVEGRSPNLIRAGQRIFWALALLAAVGAVLVRRRRRSLLVVLAPIALVVAVAAATYGSTRFRFAAEPSLVVLAAVSLEALLVWGARRRRGAAPPGPTAPDGPTPARA